MPEKSPAADRAADANSHCPNCQCSNVGHFCPECGQRQLPREHYSVRHLFGELLGNLLQWDGKLLATIALALRKPGELSALYLAGVKARYSSPVTLLLLVFFVFFLSPQLTDFTQPLSDHLSWGRWYSAPLQPSLDQLAASHGGHSQLAATFAGVQADIAKTMVLLHVPLFAFVLLLLHFRRRLYYVEHIVVASHAVATMMLLFFLALLLVLIPVQWGYELAGQPDVPAAAKNIVLWLAVKLPLLWLLYAVLKNAYRQAWYWALLKLPLAVFGFGAAHMLYRALTFWLTIALI